MSVADLVLEIEAAGVAFRLDGEKVRVSYPDEERRTELAEQIALLREQRAEVAAYPKVRSAIPPMPRGVRLIEWNLKEPPVAIETCAIVIDPAGFARATLGELRERLTNPKRKYGWPIPKLIEHLAQVGVIVTLEPKPGQVAREAT